MLFSSWGVALGTQASDKAVVLHDHCGAWPCASTYGAHLIICQATHFQFRRPTVDHQSILGRFVCRHHLFRGWPQNQQFVDDHNPWVARLSSAFLTGAVTYFSADVVQHSTLSIRMICFPNWAQRYISGTSILSSLNVNADVSASIVAFGTCDIAKMSSTEHNAIL
jgi:hypothetical protein